MSGRFDVIYSPAASDDLYDIAAYIIYKLRNPQAAKSVTGRIRREIRALSSLPERYSLVEWEPWASMGMHRFPVGNCLVFYTVDDKACVVTVTRIFYAGRDIEHIVQGDALSDED